MGAGPWKFVRWADNEIIVVTRHENYWRPGRPYLDGIEFNIIPELATALRSVVAGQNDMVIRAARAPEAGHRPREESDKRDIANLDHCVQLYINHGRAPLDNVKVRQAINSRWTRDAFVQGDDEDSANRRE